MAKEMAHRDMQRLKDSHAADEAALKAEKGRLVEALREAERIREVELAAVREESKGDAVEETRRLREALDTATHLEQDLRAKLEDMDCRRHYAEELLAKQRRELLGSPLGDEDDGGGGGGGGGGAHGLPASTPAPGHVRP